MTPPQFKIVLAEAFDPQAVEPLKELGDVVQLTSCDEASLIEAVPACDALLVRTYSEVTSKVIEKADKLKVIGRGGVGLENIDIESAQDRGIAVVYAPEAGTNAVADLAIGLMIGLIRGIGAGDRFVRAGEFQSGRKVTPAAELRELTLGIIGMGRIGRAMGRRCRNGFGMNVLYNDIVEPGWLDMSAESVSKEELYQRADVLSLHVPLTEDTRHLIQSDSLSKMKRGAYLINTSRGQVVDSEALAKCLNDGTFGGAALDVFDPEPLPKGHPLLEAPNTLFTPHVGARTRCAQQGMNAVIDDVVRVLKGKSPNFPAPRQQQ